MFSKVLHSLFSPRFDWIQVDVTSFCNAACIHCPRTMYHDRWINRHMTMETFAGLVPAFKNTKLVYLQGWGEPFLNPFFFTMVEQAKKAGCLVGTTTNGIGFDDQTIDRIIQSGLDILSFSLSQTDSCNDYVRQGAPVESVLDAMRRMTAAKKQAGIDKPSVHVSYILLRSNKDDVKNLPSRLQGLGIDEVVISTLDYVPTPELKKEEIFPQTDDEFEELSAYLENVQSEGEQRGLQIHYQIGHAGRRKLFCSENIKRALVISATGDVMPCVFANIPVSAELGEKPAPEPLVFGNITQQPVEKIWRSKDYKKFRHSFSRKQLTDPCLHCPKLYLNHFCPPAGVGSLFDAHEKLGTKCDIVYPACKKNGASE
jgi:radical SAM protein with 4Fe4S-binding SPASM domain